MAAITVKNMLTQEEAVYTCTPKEAVIAAYAQERKDFSTWQYAERYSNLVEESSNFYFCGDWAVKKG